MAASPLPSDAPRLYVVMGVAGCGKSTVGKAWAQTIGADFLEGDSYHPKANIDKMSQGIALGDDDRWPWLDRLAEAMASQSGLVVLACSALKRAYRERIAAVAGEAVLFIHLDGDRDLITERMGERRGHYMPVTLLDSQFADLESPGADENAITVDISGDEDEILERIVKKLIGN